MVEDDSLATLCMTRDDAYKMIRNYLLENAPNAIIGDRFRLAYKGSWAKYINTNKGIFLVWSDDGDGTGFLIALRNNSLEDVPDDFGIEDIAVNIDNGVLRDITKMIQPVLQPHLICKKCGKVCYHHSKNM